MPNYIRPRRPGAMIFFTVCLADHQQSLLTDHIKILREAVRYTKQRRPFGILAWVVLPDRMHAVWKMPKTDANYSQRWGMIKARFSKHIRMFEGAPPVPRHGSAGGVNPALRKGEAGIWQKRFWEHHIRDAQDLSACIHACHIAPVTQGLVGAPELWPFSSMHRDRRRRGEECRAGLTPPLPARGGVNPALRGLPA